MKGAFSIAEFRLPNFGSTTFLLFSECLLGGGMVSRKVAKTPGLSGQFLRDLCALASLREKAVVENFVTKRVGAAR